MRVLITGITGFVGSYLAEFLVDLPDIEIFGVKRWRSSLQHLGSVLDRVRLIDADITDPYAVQSCIDSVQPDRIFHLAAQSYVPSSFGGPIDALTTNIIGTAHILEAVKSVKIDPIIHVCSSSEVYGQVSANELPITETNHLRPASPYAVSKVGEDLLAHQYFLSYGLQTIRTRAFTHTGPRRGEVFVESTFAKQIAQIEMGSKAPVVHVGNLDSVRTFLDVRDVCSAYWLITEHGAAGEVYNVGGDRTMSVGEMLDFLLSLTSEKISVEVDPERLRPSDVTLQIPSVEKLKETTGWEAKIPFETTMQNLLDYWREKLRE